MENCADGILRNSVATNGTATFIHLSGSGTKEITLKDNKTGTAKKSITFEHDNMKKTGYYGHVLRLNVLLGSVYFLLASKVLNG